MNAKLNFNTLNVPNMSMISLTKPHVVFITTRAYLIVRSLKIHTIFLKHPVYAFLDLFPITCKKWLLRPDRPAKIQSPSFAAMHAGKPRPLQNTDYDKIRLEIDLQRPLSQT